ncbi:hypothetical protein [Celeribacter persicus]|uniref:Uncharacterized protein n=1 Tax=Celeribacter persicus TaxID=1651082 RepID=A0A2T5HWD1_9RHOB|nr:hypothetical protein [Celeribacter persicus]PTQ75892.1 hypothetical protein C8N42_101435 [Celeribacter persicus]
MISVQTASTIKPIKACTAVAAGISGHRVMGLGYVAGIMKDQPDDAKDQPRQQYEKVRMRVNLLAHELTENFSVLTDKWVWKVVHKIHRKQNYMQCAASRLGGAYV